MVSALGTNLKLFSTELALKVIAQHEAKIDVSSVHLSSATDCLEKTLPDAPSTPAARVEFKATPDSLIDDIASDAFMANLKTWISDTSSDATSAAQGKAMSVALMSGTLKVYDPVEGVVVKAWDIGGNPPKDMERDQITPVGWSQFLKQHVKREDGAGYVKGSDGGYLDLISGNNAYFGAVGSKFYYLTWPR